MFASSIKMHCIYINAIASLEAAHGTAVGPRQPSFVSLCAACGDRTDRKAGSVHADRYRPRGQTRLVPGDLPLGKVPLLRAGEAVLFESAVILEYLGTQPNSLHPASPLQRADTAPGSSSARPCWPISPGCTGGRRDGFAPRSTRSEPSSRGSKPGLAAALVRRGKVQPRRRGVRPDFPVFRRIRSHRRPDILEGLSAVARWRAALALRPSVVRAVAADYPAQLDRFLASRGSYLGGRFVVRTAA